MKRELIFRRTHLDASNEIIDITYWGKIDQNGEPSDDVFTAPSYNSNQHHFVDDQFTGRIVSGQRLYESDIMRFKGSDLIKIVEFRQANNAFCLVNKSDFENESTRKWLGEGIYSNPDANWWRDFGSDLKIIGNIHD